MRAGLPSRRQPGLPAIPALLALLALLFLHPAPAFAATRHIAPDGDDAGPGTADRPLATLQHGHDLASPGDTLLLRSGTYRLAGDRTEGVTLSKDGLPGRPIHVFAAPGAAPVLKAESYDAAGRNSLQSGGIFWFP